MGTMAFERLLAGMIEDRRSRFYGKYRGIVADAEDPENVGRIRARVPEVLKDETSNWALPCAPFAGRDAGFFAVPAVDAAVWIEFEAGDVSRPVWTGGWWPRDRAPAPKQGARGKQTAKVLKTDTGLQVALDDDGGAIIVSDRDGRNLMRIDSKAGNVSVTAKTKIIVDAPLIELVRGASHPLAFGDSLLNYLKDLVIAFNSHTHPGQTALGLPVTPAPPQPQQSPPTPALISTKVRTG